MTNITNKQLTVINLRYGTTAKPLKNMAFASLSAKALFHYGSPKTTKIITKQVANLLGVRAISKDLVESGLNELKDDKKVVLEDEKWILEKEFREEMRKEVLSVHQKFDSIIVNHFPRNIKTKKLKLWFNDAIVDFFTYNGDKWVQSICKKHQSSSGNFRAVDTLLRKSIKAHSFGKEAATLTRSFIGLLKSTSSEDLAFITYVGYAMFTSRLVAADIGADLIVVDELKDSTFLLDTNFLFVLHLESHPTASTLDALGRSLKTIGADIQYIDEIKKEYERVWKGKREEILKLVEIYPLEVIGKVNDDFILTALARGCKTLKDFERFFESIYELPDHIPYGPKLYLLDDESVHKEIDKAKKDFKLRRRLRLLYDKYKPKWRTSPKSDSALKHDAALIYVTEFNKRSDNKMFVITLDRSLQECSAERVGKHDIPLAICLNGLIQILAANSAGPDFDATNFAPLMNKILLNRCVPSKHTYSTQDLHWLHKIEKNVATFKPEKISTIVLEVTKARLAGKTVDDRKLQLKINRLYQEELQNTDQMVEESRERARTAEEQAQAERDKRLELEKEIQEMEKKELLRKARNKFAKSVAWRVPATIVLSLLASEIIILNFLELDTKDLFAFGMRMIALLSLGYWFLRNPLDQYRATKKISDES